MKKVISFMAVFVLFFAARAMAAEIKTSILFKDDFGLEQGSHHKQTLYTYWKYQSVGAEFDVEAVPATDYLYVRSSVTLNKGPAYIVGGISTDSAGAGYLNTGIWYTDMLGAFFMFFDGRAYWATNGPATDYLDAFLTVKRNVGRNEKAFAGLDLVFDHWWNQDHNWYLAGPYVGYKISPATSLFVRVSRAWNEADGVVTNGDSVRVGLRVNF